MFASNRGAMSADSSGFFDSISSEYTDQIRRCVPRYSEMLWAVLDYLPQQLAPRNILELGCGTGNLTLKLAEKYPDAQFHLADFSAGMIAECQRRLGPSAKIIPHVRDFRELAFPSGAIDLVASTISLHHLTDAEKRALFQKIHAWLRPGGVFVFSDQFAGKTPEIYARHLEHWRIAAKELGATEDEWKAWMQHQAEHDHHSPIADQIGWLADAGYVEIDCPWRYLLWTVLIAFKQQ
jgi:tRNA (cmo5U34)-methyltransferase